jgi:DNA-directed RNA polymerase alpha subunit
MVEVMISPFRSLTEKHYKEIGVERLNVKLNPQQSIVELKLSKRLTNVLLKNNINNVNDIYNLSTMDILGMIGLGNQLIKELEKFRFQYQVGEYYNY